MKKALIFYGGWSGHTPYETALTFEKMLKEEGYDVTLSDTLDCLNNYEEISDIDLFVPDWTMGEISGVQASNISKAVSEGAGIAGCHGGMCDAFRNCPDWQFMTGAQWVAHPGNGEVTYRVEMKSGSIFTEGLSDFSYKGEQYYLHVDPAVTVHATTLFPVSDGEYSANGTITMPVIFTKKWGKGNVFYFSIGHSFKDFEIPQANTIIRRGFLWATRK